MDAALANKALSTVAFEADPVSVVGNDIGLWGGGGPHRCLSSERISWNVKTIANRIIDHLRQISRVSFSSSVFVLG